MVHGGQVATGAHGAHLGVVTVPGAVFEVLVLLLLLIIFHTLSTMGTLLWSTVVRLPTAHMAHTLASSLFRVQFLTFLFSYFS